MTNNRLIFWLSFSGVTIIMIIVVAYLYLVERSPIDFEAIDFNQNGIVTFSELIYANAYGKRKLMIDGRSCIEYYALQDEKRLKLQCD